MLVRILSIYCIFSPLKINQPSISVVTEQNGYIGIEVSVFVSYSCSSSSSYNYYYYNYCCCCCCFVVVIAYDTILVLCLTHNA